MRLLKTIVLWLLLSSVAFSQQVLTVQDHGIPPDPLSNSTPYLPPAKHPSMFFTDWSEVAQLSARISQEPYATWFSVIEAQAMEAKDGGRTQYSNCEEVGVAALCMAFYYYVNNASTAYRDSAIAFINYNAPYQDEFAGHVGLLTYMMAYDLLYDDMSAGQRSNVMNIASAWKDNLYPIITALDPSQALIYCAATIGIFSLYYEEFNHSEAQSMLNDCFYAANYAFGYYTNYSGVWHEGPHYTKYALESFLPFHYLYYNLTGINFYTDRNYAKFLNWALFTTSPINAATFRIDDAPGEPIRTNLFYALTNRLNWKLARKAAARFRALDKTTYYSLQCTLPLAFCYYDNTVSTDSTSLGCPDQVFPEAGIAVMSDNWNGSGYEVVQLAETFNFYTDSYHEDWEGLETIVKYNGVPVVADPGYGYHASSGYNDYLYHSVITMSESDGGVVQNSDGFMFYYTSNVASYIRSQCYLWNHIWYRGTLFWKGHFVLLFDRVDDVRDDADNGYRWRFLMPARWYSNRVDAEMQLTTDTLGIHGSIWHGGNNNSTIYTTNNNAWIDYNFSEYGTKIPATQYCFTKGGANNENDVQAVNLIWAKPSSSGRSAERVKSSNGIKAWVTGEQDTIVGLVQFARSTQSDFGVTQDGYWGGVGKSGSNVVFMMLYSGKNIKIYGTTHFNSSVNTSTHLCNDGTKWFGKIKLDSSPGTVKIRTPAPTLVYVDGIITTPNYDGTYSVFNFNDTNPHTVNIKY